MSRTTKIVLLLNVIASVILVIIVASALYGWYVGTNYTESVDVSTNGIVLTYDIDEKNDLNVETYSISNLVFFDTDSENEGKYFTDMAHVIKIEIFNKSKKNVDITLSYVVDEDRDANDPYATCIIVKSNDLDSSNEDGSVEDYISTNHLASTNTELDVAKDDKATFYVYIYGIQPDDSASNDFLYEDISANTGKEYIFQLRIEATITEGQEAEIVEAD